MIKTAIDVIQDLLEVHPQIAELTIFQPDYAPPAQKRIKEHARTREVVESGLRVRRELGLPFWDSVLVSCYGAGEAVSSILEQALFHNSPPKREFTVAKSEWPGKSLQQQMEKLPSGDMLVLSSRVRLADGSNQHIPMLDFHCPANEQNDGLVQQAAKLLSPFGAYLLYSGRSYHLYGKKLLSETELNHFLARALLLSPITDRAWIAHQLLEGACGLRISMHLESGTMPGFFAEFG